MHIAIDVNTNLNISSLKDLPKLKLLMESLNMKINKSELARKFKVDRRTISKYLEGYKPVNKRQRTSKIDKHYDTIKHLLSDETPSAELAQIDWKENIRYVTKDGEVIYVNVCVFLLAYSRFRTYHLSLSKSQDVLFSFLTESFESIGGVPKTILVDNMKSIMDEPRTRYQSGKVNERFHQFSSDFNFEVIRV